MNEYLDSRLLSVSQVLRNLLNKGKKEDLLFFLKSFIYYSNADGISWWKPLQSWELYIFTLMEIKGIPVSEKTLKLCIYVSVE